METWAILVLVIGLNIITVVSSYFLAKMKVSHSDKRLERQLEDTRDADYRQRRREVRSKPLLKLKGQLAIMAAKQNRVVAAAHGVLDKAGNAREGEAKKELKEAKDDWNNYREGPWLSETLFIQSNPELVRKVLEIQERYIAYYDNIMDCMELAVAKREEAMGRLEETWPKVIEVQSLINKLLEDLKEL